MLGNNIIIILVTEYRGQMYWRTDSNFIESVYLVKVGHSVPFFFIYLHCTVFVIVIFFFS